MTYEFKLPDIGEGLTEGEVVKWHVKVGDTVAENQPLCNVLTDKAEVEVPSPRAGKIVKLFAKPGEKVKVHAPLVSFETSLGDGGKSAGGDAKPSAKPVEKAHAQPAPAKAAAPASAPRSGAVHTFKLPDIGEGLTEGEVVKWHVKEGDTVKENQPLCNVLTDKAEVEIPSPRGGTIVKLYAKAGEKVKVHAALVDFAGAGATAEVGAAHKGNGAPSQASMKAETRGSAAPKSGAAVLATPRVRNMAKELGIDLSTVRGSGPEGRVLEGDLRSSGTAAVSKSDANVNASAAVKRLAKELGVDITTLTGTGPGGRIAEWDVRKSAPKAETTVSARSASPSASKPTAPIVVSAASAPSQGEERTPFVGIRRKIAEHLSHGMRTVVPVTHMDECDMTEVIALRDQLRPEAAKRGVKLTFLPFIIRALAKALKEFPQLNSSLDDARGELITKRYYNLGIAVNAGQGLVVPNIKGADGKDLWTLAAEVQQLAEKVRAGKIDLASLQGGTFTITNIGPIGGLFATPIVNHPETAILGLMKLQKRPMVRDGGLFVRDMMNLVLSFDHRVIDGADAASFMNTLIKFLENPRTVI